MNLSLLRAALNAPIIWEEACKKAEALPHTLPAADCLPCLAKLRRTRDEHALGEALTGETFCKKCGLLKAQWASAPKCSNKKKPTPPDTRPEPAYRIIPVD